MTDKEKIRAEVKRLSNQKWHISIENVIRNDIYRGLLEFIDNLPEEHVSEDLEKAAKKYAIEQVLCTTDTKMPEQAYLSIRIFNGYDLACAYKDGAESQREQMMKDAIDAEVEWYDGLLLNYTQEAQDIALEKIGTKIGDKVKLIIIKEDRK